MAGAPLRAGWFGRNFQRDQVEQLGWDYEAEISLYKKALLFFLKKWKSGMYFKVQCSLPEFKSNYRLQARTDSVIPINQVPLEQFQIKFTASDGHSFSELSNFVYFEGAYRYLGKGAYPFWAMPDATRKVNP